MDVALYETPLRATILRTMLPNGHPMHVTHDPAAAATAIIDFNSFLAVDIRVGTIVDAKPVSYTHLTLPTILRV